MDNIPASLVIKGISLPVLAVNSEEIITVANAAAVEMLGHDPTGLNAVTLLRQAPVLTALNLSLRDGRESNADFLMTRTGGEELTFNIHFQPVDNKYVVLSFTDTSVKESADKIRRDFIANISHELRTPLTGLTGFIETLRTTARDDPDARDRFLSIMDHEAKRMGRMVEDLLSLSRVETDERIRPRAPIKISGVLRSVIATLEGKLGDANIEVITEGFDTGNWLVLGDRDQLIQLFLNLIENAIKYGGQDRTITVRVSDVPRDPALRIHAVRIEVVDQGNGINSVHLPRLTERFYRVDDHRSRDMGGTGLGLAIVKHIVNRHRGRLKVNSEQGVGSVFSVFLPTVEHEK
ncbi:MAG: ATP-binding protein [Litoreibacter sp.]